MLGRNARQEAQEIVGPEFEARVLEPSPPSVDKGEWFADDPVAVEPRMPGRLLLSPVPNGDLTWSTWLADHPECAEWASARWLAAYRRLASPPATLVETRLALHRLVVYVISPARQRANGKMALRWTLDGFGTPFFGRDEQVRIAGSTLIRQSGGHSAAEPIVSLSCAARFVLDSEPDLAWAESFDVPPVGDLDEKLPVDPEAAAFLANWYGFAWSVLEELRSDPLSSDPSRVQLWPEHFDAAFDCLDPERRGTFGASPGDVGVPEPYLYVISPGVDSVPTALWNATTFRGAILPLSELLHAADQRTAALEFFRSRRSLLLA
jgi:hypothetical protein